MEKSFALKSLVFVFLIFIVSSFSFALTRPINGVLYYNFSDTTDLWGSNNGINYGATSINGYPTYNVSGDSSPTSFSFDGNNDYVNIGILNINSGSSFSMSVWVNLSSDTEGQQWIISQEDSTYATGSGFYFRWLRNSGTDGYWDIGMRGSDGSFYGATSSLISIPTGSWEFLTAVFDDDNNTLKLYVNGVLVDTTSISVTMSNFNSNIRIGQRAGGSGSNVDGIIDEVKIYNRSLNSVEINNLYNYGSIFVSSPIFIPPSPVNDAHNNTQVTFNINCSSNNVYAWFDGNLTISNITGIANFTTNEINSGNHIVKASCYSPSLDSFSNNISRNWTYDIVYPAITLNNNNAFDINNYSQVSQYYNFLPLNITFTDDIDLYAYSINVTKNNGALVLYDERNENLSGLSYNYFNNLNSSSWVNGWYDIEIMVSDSHTKNKIDDYKVKKENKKLTFETAEKNVIEISSEDDAVTDSSKSVDRYDFQFDFNDTNSKSINKKGVFSLKSNNKKRVFNLKSNNKIVYREGSNYKGHFIIFNEFGGNWVDFEGVSGVPEIRKISDYHYEITFDKVEDTVKFNSIGGLNVLVANHRWYKGDYVLNAPSSAVGDLINISLNLTRDFSQDNFSASLFYNGTLYQSPIKSDDGSIVNFVQEITSGSVEGDLEYYWNITYNQTDSSIINFNLNGTHEVFDWGLVNCSGVGNNVSLILSVYDENFPLVDRNSVVDLEIKSWVSNPDNYNTYEAKLSGDSKYYICLYPQNQNLNIDYYAQYEVDGGFKHRYYLYDFVINNNTQNITMYNTNESVDFSDLIITARRTDNYRYFENVVAKLQRRYVDEGVWRTIQMDQSGDYGNIIFHILEQNTDYRIMYFDTFNNLLKQTETLKFSCEDNRCEITQLLDETGSVVVGENISVSTTFDNSTGLLKVYWEDPVGNNNKVQVRVGKETLTGTLNICDVFQTGSSGIVDCNVSGYYGSLLVTVLTSNSPYTPIYSSWIELLNIGLFNELDTIESVFWAVGLSLTIVAFGLWSAAATIIAFIVSLIVILFLGLFEPITLTFIIVAIVMGIAIATKVKK